jgi:hypothetical protein
MSPSPGCLIITRACLPSLAAIIRDGRRIWARRAVVPPFYLIRATNGFCAGAGDALLTLGEIVRCDFSGCPNVARWLGNMKRLRSWPEINEALYGFAESVKHQSFDAI